MKRSLARRPTVADLIPFFEGLDTISDPNVKRVWLAAQTLVAYQRLSDPDSWESSAASHAVTDVLTNLLHISPIVGSDFEALLADARGHFAEEAVDPWR